MSDEPWKYHAQWPKSFQQVFDERDEAERLASEAYPGDLWNEQAEAKREAFAKGYVAGKESLRAKYQREFDENMANIQDALNLTTQLEVERERSAKLIERLKRFANGFAKTDLLLSAEIAVILNRLIKVYEAKADE